MVYLTPSSANRQCPRPELDDVGRSAMAACHGHTLHESRTSKGHNTVERKDHDKRCLYHQLRLRYGLYALLQLMVAEIRNEASQGPGRCDAE